MPSDAPLKIALVGNPNSGKSSLFNALTGLKQKVGNFPGVTVDKKVGSWRLEVGSVMRNVHLLDLPGTYSLYPKSEDEKITYEVLINPQSPDRPELIIVIADASNLKRNLLFCSQIMDLKIPVVIALTMGDIARRKGITVDTSSLERMMGVPVAAINPRKGRGLQVLKKIVADVVMSRESSTGNREAEDTIKSSTDDSKLTPHASRSAIKDFIDLRALAGEWLDEVKSITFTDNNYAALHIACNWAEMSFLSAAQRIRLAALLDEVGFQKRKVQAEEVLQRYARINTVMAQSVITESPIAKTLRSERIDKVLLHPLWGNVILLGVLFLLFQSIFTLAQFPMDWVENGFALLGRWLGGILPDNWFRDLLVNGLLAGISGIAVFVPQIMLLFGFITILEDTGYMARISFLTDRLMRSVGLNGRSVMPLISGMACAVPAIMAARTIQNRKERLITILVTPLMSCSARLPVYTILIALVIPSKYFLGIFSLQGLVLMGLYLLGFAGALLVSKVMTLLIKVRDRSFFLMELPVYRAPRWKNVGITMVEKAKIFVTDAGKVIMVISLLLWALSSFGPPKQMHTVDEKYAVLAAAHPEQKDVLERDRATERLEHSFAGHLGHAIEPAIRPLGFDWKIGIALITSFAAREVFVGTMATLYSVGSDAADDAPLRAKMAAARREDGTPVYTFATGLSLLIFYVFAMQCMSTLAIVRRETRSWKWPVVQFAYMLVMAWVGAFAAYMIAR
jgi:ferrous iron transport protein B